MYFPKTDAIIDSRNKSINHAKNLIKDTRKYYI